MREIIAVHFREGEPPGLLRLYFTLCALELREIVMTNIQGGLRLSVLVSSTIICSTYSIIELLTDIVG